MKTEMDRGCLNCINKSACVVMDEQSRTMTCEIQKMKEERNFLINHIENRKRTEHEKRINKAL